jgi:hypothetical protein
MKLTAIDRVTNISPEAFREQYLLPARPVIITELSHSWPAFKKWDWDFFKGLVGQVRVGVYNNIRAGANVPVNGADDTMLFGEYLDLIRKGPAELRIFLFNVFKHAPHIVEDFSFPTLIKGFLKNYPMLFVGGAGSIAHMHYDLDLSHIFHTQFIGRKRVLLLDNSQSPLIYKMPATVESAASFVNWHEHLDTEQFPALKYAQAYEAILEHGDTLFMPSGYWHHMQYMDSGFAMSLRALPEGISPKINTLYHLLGIRGFNNMLIRMAPEWWYHYKRKYAQNKADNAIKKLAFS